MRTYHRYIIIKLSSNTIIYPWQETRFLFYIPDWPQIFIGHQRLLDQYGVKKST